jgi:hypothetical protein
MALNYKTYYCFRNEGCGKNDFKLIEVRKLSKGKNYFDTKEEATEHFKSAEKKANEKYALILDGLEKLRSELGDFSYSYYFIGDTYGIEEDGSFIQFEVDGYHFKFEYF